LTGVCLIVAGVVRATLPADSFTLAWQHSVEKTRWEERYRVDGERLVLAEASVQGSGAGMEPAPGAMLRNGAWVWRPDRPVDELRLTESSFVRDYELCAQSRCAPLARWIGPLDAHGVVTIKPCEAQARSGGAR
jgi:hypothetical protein